MRVVALTLWLLLVVAAVMTVGHVQRSGRRELNDRLTLRANVGAQFVESYVEDVFCEQRQLVLAFLSEEDPSAERFRWVTESLGYPAAVLLDDQGRALHVAPAAPGLSGRTSAPGTNTSAGPSAVSPRSHGCLASGMDEYLSKPVKGSHLLSVVSRWVAEGRSPAQAASF